MNLSNMATIDIRLACTRVKKQRPAIEEPEHLMTPGDVITTDTGFMRCASIGAKYNALFIIRNLCSVMKVGGR